MDSLNTDKPSFKDRIRNWFSTWNVQKIARVVLYSGGVIFVVALVISAGRTPQSKTATTVTQAPAAFKVDKWYDNNGIATVKSGGRVKVHLRIINPGNEQAAVVKDYFPPGFTFVSNSYSIDCLGTTPNRTGPGVTNYYTIDFFAGVAGTGEPVPARTDTSSNKCEITYDLLAP